MLCRFALVGAFVLSALGCSSDAESGASDTPADDWQNDSFDSARELAVGDPIGALETVTASDEQDWFRFRGARGQWVELTTTRHIWSPDTIITLYDASGVQLAENDEGARYAGDEFDARLVVRLPDDADYYVLVEDRVTPAAYFESSAADLYYRFRVRELRAVGGAIDSERGDLPELADDAAVEWLDVGSDTIGVGTVAGTFDHAGDVDGFYFETTRARAALLALALPGTAGSGSASPAGAVWISDYAGEVVGSVQQDAGQNALRPSLVPGGYRLRISPPEGTPPGSYYVIDLALVPENPGETEDNDTLANAQPVALVDRGDSARAYLLFHLPAGDVDNAALDVVGGDAVSTTCWSHADGSGVLGLTLELLDPDGVVIASSIETLLEGSALDHVAVPRDGRYVLRLRADGHSQRVAGDWVRCRIDVDRGSSLDD